MGTTYTHIYTWDRVVLSVGPGRDLSSHRHFGAILVFAPDGPITLTGRDGAHRVQAALIAPNAMHQFEGENCRTLNVLIGADHPWFCYIKPHCNGAPIVPLPASQFLEAKLPLEALFEGAATCDTARDAVLRLLELVGGAAPTPHRIDERIATVLKLLDEDIANPPPLAELSRRSGLSAFTLMRRFKRELGVRIGEYVLWRRMMVALRLVDGRSTVAEIAQRTGFYDQAHLTRTVRRMVELAPSYFNDLNQTRVHVCRPEEAASR